MIHKRVPKPLRPANTYMVYWN